MKNFQKIIVLLVVLTSVYSFKSKDLNKYPRNGYLMLLGGGISESHASLFLKIAGGKGSKIIVIPTAYSDKQIERDPTFLKIKNRFRKVGIDSIEVLHTRSHEIANSEDFIKSFKSCDAVFFLGGNTASISDAYANTKVHDELKKLLDRDGIIAGVSAGSGVQANYFYNDSIKKGFGFLPDVIIMNHFFKRNKQFDHIEEIKNNKEYLAIGIDDNTAIVVNDNKLEVVGSSYAAIYDGKNYSRYKDSISKLPEDSDRFYVLQNGDRYDLEKREVISNKRLSNLKYSAMQLKEYQGHYKSTSNAYEMDCVVKNDTLFLKNSWGWNPYPIFPYKKDIFFARNRTMWFKFTRDSISNKISGSQKMKSILQEDIIVNLTKLK